MRGHPGPRPRASSVSKRRATSRPRGTPSGPTGPARAGAVARVPAAAGTPWTSCRSGGSGRRTAARRHAGPAPSPAAVSATDRTTWAPRPSSSGCANCTSGHAHCSPSASRSKRRAKTDSVANGWNPEHSSCTKPGSVASTERTPPPGTSAASRTTTSTPAAARVTAAASPLGRSRPRPHALIPLSHRRTGPVHPTPRRIPRGACPLPPMTLRVEPGGTSHGSEAPQVTHGSESSSSRARACSVRPSGAVRARRQTRSPSRRPARHRGHGASGGRPRHPSGSPASVPRGRL